MMKDTIDHMHWVELDDGSDPDDWGLDMMRCGFLISYDAFGSILQIGHDYYTHPPTTEHITCADCLKAIRDPRMLRVRKPERAPC